jgi:hypothetical protein
MVTFALFCGCVKKIPVEQVQMFNQALDNMDVASQPLFDDLAIAERALGKRVAESQAQSKKNTNTLQARSTDANSTDVAGESQGETGHHAEIELLYCQDGDPGWQKVFKDQNGEMVGFIAGFCLEDAAYFSDLAEPPATRALRTGIDALRQYSQVLLVLAEDRNIEQARMQLRVLGGISAGTLVMIPGGQGPAAMILPVLEALGPLLDAAIKAQNFKEMIRLVSSANEQFAKLVLALKATTPYMFDTLTRSAARKAPNETINNPELGVMVVTQINGYRKALSSYIVLLEVLEQIHVEMVKALNAAEDEPLSLTLVVNRAEQLNNQANALRQVLATLRRGVAP